MSESVLAVRASLFVSLSPFASVCVYACECVYFGFKSPVRNLSAYTQVSEYTSIPTDNLTPAPPSTHAIKQHDPTNTPRSATHCQPCPNLFLVYYIPKSHAQLSQRFTAPQTRRNAAAEAIVVNVPDEAAQGAAVAALWCTVMILVLGLRSALEFLYAGVCDGVRELVCACARVW